MHALALVVAAAAYVVGALGWWLWRRKVLRLMTAIEARLQAQERALERPRTDERPPRL